MFGLVQRMLGLTPTLEGFPRSYVPVCENVPQILNVLKPEGKRVLSVTAFGYPLVFASAGAKEVHGFDVSGGQIFWNELILDAIRNGVPQKELRAVFSAYSTKDFFDRAFMKRVQIPDWEKRGDGSLRRLVQHLDAADPEKLMCLVNHYPFLHSSESFSHLRCLVYDQRISYDKGDVCEVLRFMQRDGRKFDAVYISTIRSWMLSKGFRDNELAFRDYDAQLLNGISRVLVPGGLFYEVALSTSSGLMRMAPELSSATKSCTRLREIGREKGQGTEGYDTAFSRVILYQKY